MRKLKMRMMMMMSGVPGGDDIQVEDLISNVIAF